MKPNCHISLGRSGGTLAMKLLSSNPHLVTDQSYPFETFIANHIVKSYHILTAKSEPSVYPKYGSPTGLVGPFPDYNKSPNDSVFSNALRDASQTVLKPMCKKFIIEIYSNIAKAQGKTEPTHFIEKFGYFLVSDLRELFEQIYQIVFIRDVRDLLSSIKDFNKKRGFKSFGAENYENFSEYIQGSFFHKVNGLHKFVERNDCLVVRYEDFILRKKEVIIKIFEYVGIDYEYSHIDSAISQSEKTLDEHRTSKTAQESIRKFDTILTSKEINLCNSLMGDILEYYNYLV